VSRRAQSSPAVADVLALQRSIGNHAVGNVLARRDPNEGTKTAISAKVLSIPSKWGELSVKLSRAATRPAATDWPPYMQQPKFEIEFKDSLAWQAQAHDACVHPDPARER
jgi:hypothetical protein